MIGKVFISWSRIFKLMKKIFKLKKLKKLSFVKVNFFVKKKYLKFYTKLNFLKIMNKTYKKLWINYRIFKSNVINQKV
jgi:hypothetical protein